MVSTRQLKRVDREKWVYRTDKGDYGPVSTDGILDAIRERAIDLKTQISVVGTNKWTTLGEFALFRDHYEVCKGRWETEALHAEADKLGKRMERKGAATAHAWRLIGLGALVALGVGSWLVWKLLHAEPLGISRLAKVAVVAQLPKAEPPAKLSPPLPDPKEKKLARLNEPESYDTAGVTVGAVDEGPTVTKMAFDEEGEVQQIAPDDLARVVEGARQALYACARDAVAKNTSFPGTEVSFTVSPGRLTRVAVGTEARGNPAFVACVKAGLARVGVPSFNGSERRVSVPLRFQR